LQIIQKINRTQATTVQTTISFETNDFNWMLQ